MFSTCPPVRACRRFLVFFIRPNKGTPIEANRRREIDRGVQTMQIDMENTRTIESRRQSTVIWLINSTVASSSGRGEWRLSGARSRDTVGQRSVNRLRHRCPRSTSIKRGRRWTIDCIYHQLQASPTNLHWGSVAIYTARGQRWAWNRRL